MTRTAFGPILQLIRRVAADPCARHCTDQELLRRFLDQHDEPAFDALVRRHGPMVLDVCRGVLPNEADVEDAFQATFLILARKAGSIRKTASLASWLHGVAYRTAWKVRTDFARRRKYEDRAPPPAPDGTADDLAWREVRQILHQELNALSERFRAPLVLCYLEGRTQDEAAALLGLAKSTLKERLERGRALLRARLIRRGLGTAGLLILATWAATATAVPPALTAAAVRVAAHSASGGVVPASVLSLAERGARSMSATKLILGLCLLPAAVLGLARPGTPDHPGPIPGAPAAAAEPDKKDAPVQRGPGDLAGVWKVQDVQTAGKSLLAAGDLKDAQLVFKDNRAEVKGLAVDFVRDFSFTFDSTKTPREIDVTFQDGPRKGETLQGIYVARKNEIRICLRVAYPKLGRPAGFDTISGTTLYTFILGPEQDGAAPAAPTPLPSPQADAPAKKCRVTGTLASIEYAKVGGTLDRAIVTVYTDPGRDPVAKANEKGTAFAFDLPLGNYALECTGVGSRGATFVPSEKKFAVKAGDARLDLGAIDMPASKITKLFGQPAPELEGAVGWKNTDPMTLKGLKGKVVVLDFWSYSCTICLHHKPDLAQLAEKYKGKELAVLTVHDSSLDTMEEVDKHVPEAIKQKAGHLPIALDGAGAKSIFRSYGITAVPMVILIDPEGRVVRRFHHAGDPELDREVEKLLGMK